MTILDGQRVIAIEEHYYDEEVASHFQGLDAKTGGFVREKLGDVGEARIASMDEAGIDRILFAVDYPFVPNEPGPKWMERLMLNSEDKAKILHGNAESLLRMGPGATG